MKDGREVAMKIQVRMCVYTARSGVVKINTVTRECSVVSLKWTYTKTLHGSL